MGGIPAEQREATLAWLATAEGDQVLAALSRLREALQRERQANSTEARIAAQEEALRADAALAEATGIAQLRRRRILAELGAEEDRHPLDERGYREGIDRAIRDDTPKTRNALRRAVWRMVYDLGGIVGNRLAFHVAAHMREVSSGRIGLMHVEPRQGVDRESAAAYALRAKTVAAAGYTVGAEVLKTRVPRAYWERAAEAHNRIAAGLETDGVKVAPVTAAAVRDWCTRQGEWRIVFEQSRHDGRRDRAALAVDEDRLLPARRPK